MTEPLLALSRATEEVGERRYAAMLPEPRSNDEIGELTERFREMTERLAEAEAYERNFLVRVSHELRTPLTAIRGHVAALREGLADDPDATAASLEVIRAATDRLARLVGDLVDLARLEAHSFTLDEEEVELKRLVEQGYQSFAEEARRRDIRYELALGADPVVQTDGDRVLQIVSNLLANAFSWTPDGGSISLMLSQANGSVSVAVTDSGPGIPPDDRDRVFRPFVSDNGGGTGLGLAISRELAEALGGDLTLHSVVGRGSRFELRLPSRLSVLGLEAVDAVEGGSRPLLERPLHAVEDALGAVEAPLDAAPAGADQLDEEGQVLQSVPALGGDLRLEPVESPDELSGQPAHLGDLARDRQDLGMHPLLDRGTETLRHDRLELGGRPRKLVERASGPLERVLEIDPARRLRSSVREPRPRPFQCFAIHGPGIYPWRRTA